MEHTVVDWLFEGPAWVQARAVEDLSAGEIDPAKLSRLRESARQDPAVQSLLVGLADWPGTALSSHKAAGHALHQMVFLADLGLTVDDPGIQRLAERMLATTGREGPQRTLMNISPSYGGSGKDELAWALCDAPLNLYGLAKFGLAGHPAVQKAAEFLAGLVRDNGWPCAVSPELGKFRGPGRKEDPCPFANLIMLQALAQFAEYRDSPATRAGVEAALRVWSERVERHPYMFYMGTDFCKLKAPLVWYDLLHALDVLSQYPWVSGDARFNEMLDVLRAKADAQGRYTPESVWTAWKDWEFGQKKAPSRWVTLVARRVMGRMRAEG